MGLLRRKKLSQRIYRVAAMFESIARQLRVQSRNMERQAERKFERVKELYRKGLTEQAIQDARKVVVFKRRAVKLDSLAENLTDISTTLTSMAPLADIKRALKDSIKVARSLTGVVSRSTLSELLGELRSLMVELGITVDMLGEPEGMADVTAEPVPEAEVREVLEKAAMEVGAELPEPELAGLEERLKELKEKGEK